MKLTDLEIADLCRELALLIHGGIGAADGIFLLAEEEQGRLRPLLQEMGAGLDGGSSLATVMELSGAFPLCVTGMVQVGERTGRMEVVLSSLGKFYEQRSRSHRQIKQALAYPVAILGLMLVVIGVLLVQVLPIFDKVYASLGSGLTGVAAGLLQLGTVLVAAMPMLLTALAILTLTVILYTKCVPIQEKVNRMWISRFGDRGVLRKFNNANFARALAIGLGGALPLEEAVEQAGELLADIPGAATRCAKCAASLREGKNLASAMGEADFLTPAESRMLAVAIRQGSADAVMEHIADRLLEDAQEALEQRISKVEPAMVLVTSLLVGAILLTVMLPLMNIMAAIG